MVETSCMRSRISFLLVTLLGMTLGAVDVAASVVSAKSIRARHGETDYHFDVYRSAVRTQKKSPGLILVPEFWGKEKLIESHARNLAAQGYIVLVVDLYGNNRSSIIAEEAYELQRQAEEADLDTQLSLIERAVDQLKEQPGVDRERIGAVGFGYGGGLALNHVKKGVSGLSAVVSFYGGVKKLRVTSQIGRLPELLYVRPELDNYVSDSEFGVFEKEIARTGFKLEVLKLRDAQHGFVNRDIELYGQDLGKSHMSFDERAAKAAWAKMLKFLDEKLKQ